MLYSSKLNDIRSIVNDIYPDDGVIVRKAKEAVNDSNSFKDIFDINDQYLPLLSVIDLLNSKKCALFKQAFKILMNFDFKEDNLYSKDYIIKRLHTLIHMWH